MPGFQRLPKQKILKNNWSLPNVVLSKNALANQTKLSTQFPTLWVTYKGEFWPNLHTKPESETALTFPSPRFRMSIAKCDFGASAFYLKKYHLSLHIFWKLCQAKPQPLTFCNQVWEFGLYVTRHDIKVFNLQAGYEIHAKGMRVGRYKLTQPLP